MGEVANGSSHEINYVEEASYGVTPSNPVFKALRNAGTTLGMDRSSITSSEITSTRQITNTRLGNTAINGDVNGELSFLSYDDFLEALIGHDRANYHADTITVAATGETFTDSNSNLPIFVVGENVSISGFTEAGNNGTFEVAASTASVLTVVEDVTVDEAAVTDQFVTIVSTVLKADTGRRFFTVERQFTNIATPEWHGFKGCEANTLALEVAPDAIVTANFGFIGQAQEAIREAIISGATYEDNYTTEPMDSFSGIVTEGGGASAVVTSISLNIDNGISQNYVVGSVDTIQPSRGKINVSGSMTVFYESKALLEKFQNETESALVFTLVMNSQTYEFNLPRIVYTGGKPDVPDDQAISLTMPLQAIYDSTEASNIVITRTA
jgi:hypothetical protein